MGESISLSFPVSTSYLQSLACGSFLFKKKKKIIYLFNLAASVLVAARGIFVAVCRIFCCGTRASL